MWNDHVGRRNKLTTKLEEFALSGSWANDGLAFIQLLIVSCMDHNVDLVVVNGVGMQITASAKVTRHKRQDLSWAENLMWIGANWWGVQPQGSRYLYTIHPWLYYLGSPDLSMRCIRYWSVFCLLMMMQYDVIMTQWLAIFQQISPTSVVKWKTITLGGGFPQITWSHYFQESIGTAFSIMQINLQFLNHTSHWLPSCSIS